MVKTLLAIGLGLGIAYSLTRDGAPVGLLYPVLIAALLLAFFGGRRRLKPAAAATAVSVAQAEASAEASSTGNQVTVNVHTPASTDEPRDVVIAQVLNAEPPTARQLERTHMAELERAGFTGEDVDDYGADELAELLQRTRPRVRDQERW